MISSPSWPQAVEYNEPIEPEPPPATPPSSSLFRLLEVLSERGRSAVLTFRSSNGRRGAVYLRDGAIIDAELGSLTGEAAFYEILTGPGDRLQIEVKPDRVRHRVAIERHAQDLMRESLRRATCWYDWSARLPSLDSVLTVNFATLGSLEMPADVAAVVRLFDGQRTLMDVIDDSKMLRLPTMEVLLGLTDVDALQIADRADDDAKLADATEVDEWLAHSAAQSISWPRVFVAVAGVIAVAALAASLRLSQRQHHAPLPVVIAAPPVVAIVVPRVEVAAAATSDPVVLLREAATLRQRGKLRQAQRVLERAAQDHPQNVEVLVALAQCALDQGESKVAAAFASQVTRIDATMPAAFLVLGASEQDLGHRFAARVAYSRYLELAPTGTYAADIRAVLLSLR